MSWNLASLLANGRWNERRIKEVQLHRSVTEKIGREVMAEDGRIIPPIFQDIAIDFSAQKFTADDDNETVVLYKLMSTVAQDLEQHEWPKYVIDEIFADADEEELEEIFGVGVTSRDEVDWSEYELKREQSVEYQYNGLGDVQQYGLTYRYSIDNNYAYETTYDSENGLRMTVPVRNNEGEVIDERPAILLYLTEANLPSEIEDLDKKWWDFIDEAAMHEMLHLGGQSPQEHAVQVMRTLALLSSGLFTTRDLLRKKPTK